MPEALSPSDWAAIRAAYESGSETPVAIARRYGIHHFNIYNSARRDAWVPPVPPLVVPPPRRPKPTTLLDRDAATPSNAIRTRKKTHRRMVERLYSIIDAKLSQMENRMPGQDDQKSTDHEREAKTIGTLISNIEKVQELDGDAAKSRTLNNKAVTSTHLADDTERLGRDLAERLIRRAREHQSQRSASGIAQDKP
jgi:hypothetical protein